MPLTSTALRSDAWRARPILAPTAAVVIGTLGADALASATWAIVAVGTLAAATLVARVWPRSRIGVPGLAMLAAIAATTAWRASAVREPHDGGVTRAPGAARGIGEWKSDGTWSDRERGSLRGSKARFELEAGLVRDGELLDVRSRDEAPVYARGPVVGPAERSGRAPPLTLAPDDFVRVAPAARGSASWIAAHVEELRITALARVGTLRDPQTAGLVSALLFGDTSRLESGVPDLFVRTGTYHILAISGLQVAMVAALFLWPIGALLARLAALASRGRLDPGAAFFRVALLVLFVPIAGAGAPVVRAAIAWAIGSLAPFVPVRAGADTSTRLQLGRRADAISLWAFALMLEALARPTQLDSLSVQLSYAATAGLICATGPLLGVLRRAWPGEARIADVDALGRARSVLWRIPLQRALDVGLGALAASCAACIATLPWTWDRFGEWSPVGWIATPLSALPTFALMAVGWFHVIATPVSVEPLADVLARGLIELLAALDGVPSSPCMLPPRPFALLASACFGTLLLVGRRSRATRLVAIAWGALLLPWTARPNGLELHALDVGAGTAVVWRAPGAGTWIFDAGSRDRPDVARQAVMPLLAAWDVGSIHVVLSHSDRDHDGALPFVAERIPVAAWLGAVPTHAGEHFPHAPLAFDVDEGRARVLRGAGARAAVEVALDRPLCAPGNEGSRSLRIRWGEDEIVLCGDAEEEGLARWLASSAPRAGVRLLLLPHHGSEGPYLGELLRRTTPREIWVSAGPDLASARELERRAATGHTWRWTARDGPLELSLPAPPERCANGHTGCDVSHAGA